MDYLEIFLVCIIVLIFTDRILWWNIFFVLSVKERAGGWGAVAKEAEYNWANPIKWTLFIVMSTSYLSMHLQMIRDDISTLMLILLSAIHLSYSTMVATKDFSSAQQKRK